MSHLEGTVIELQNWEIGIKKAQQRRRQAQMKYYERTSPIEEQVQYHSAQIDAILKEMEADPDVIAATDTVNRLNLRRNEARERAETECRQLWVNGALPNKTFDILGCQFKVKETTKRRVFDQEVMVAEARIDGVYGQVIGGAKYVLKRKAWNSWVDLHHPDGVTIEKVVSATVTLKEETDG